MALRICKIFAALYIVACLYFIWDAIDDKAFYKHLYGMDSSGLHWRFKSFTNYFAVEIGNIILGVLYILLANKYTHTKNDTILIILLLMTAWAIFYCVRSHILNVESGYDHYPGFDPYFF